MSTNLTAAELVTLAQEATTTAELDEIEAQAAGRVTVLNAVSDARARLARTSRTSATSTTAAPSATTAQPAAQVRPPRGPGGIARAALLPEPTARGDRPTIPRAPGALLPEPVARGDGPAVTAGPLAPPTTLPEPQGRP